MRTISLFLAFFICSPSFAASSAWLVKASGRLKFPSSCISETLNPNLGGDIRLVQCGSDFELAKIFSASEPGGDVQVEENQIWKPADIELSDPESHDQWALDALNVKHFWETESRGDARIKVAIIDTGVDYLHEDLRENIAVNTAEIPGNGIDDDNNGYVDDYYGWNAFSNNSDPMDFHQHGTHIAGVIGAVPDNGIGVAGLNWKVSIIPIRFFGENGGSTDVAIRAFDYAVARGAKIVNLSWGGYRDSPLLKEIIARCAEKGILVVAAAGNESNDNDSTPFYPATFPLDNIISVGSIDWRGESSSFSNFGAKTVHVAAPGESVLSTIPNRKYGFMQGTSMAAPQIAGAAALLMAVHPGWSYSDVKGYILGHCQAEPSLAGRVGCGGYFRFW